MKGDTPIKTGQNRQCIDNITDYDREQNRIFKSVCHRLDLGPKMLPGAQQHTTVESAAALNIQDKIEGKYDEDMHNIANNFLPVFAVSGPFTSFLVLHTISWFSHSEVCAFVWGIFVRGLRVETFVRVLRSSELSLNNCK